MKKNLPQFEKLMKRNFMSYPQKEVIGHISDIALEVAEHVMLIVLFPNASDKDKEHWKKEIFTWINKQKLYNDIKPNGRKLRKDILENNIYNYVFLDGSIEKYIIKAYCHYMKLNNDSKTINMIINTYKDKESMMLETIKPLYDKFKDYISGKLSDDQIKVELNNFNPNIV